MPELHFPHTACQPPVKSGNDLSIHAKTSAENNVPFIDKANGFLHFTATTLPDKEEFAVPPSPRAYKVGYARVSSSKQKLDSQLDALKQAGCHKVFSDRISGIKVQRPQWDQLVAYVRPGDSVVVTELSRMSRSLIHLLDVVQTFERQGIELVSLRENIDTSTATGRAFLAMMGVMSQMERELKAERTAAGRAAAKARGRTGGRPRTDPDKLEQARVLYLNSDRTAAQVCRTVGIGRRTLFSHLAQVRRRQTANA